MAFREIGPVGADCWAAPKQQNVATDAPIVNHSVVWLADISRALNSGSKSRANPKTHQNNELTMRMEARRAICAALSAEFS